MTESISVYSGQWRITPAVSAASEPLRVPNAHAADRLEQPSSTVQARLRDEHDRRKDQDEGRAKSFLRAGLGPDKPLYTVNLEELALYTDIDNPLTGDRMSRIPVHYLTQDERKALGLPDRIKEDAASDRKDAAKHASAGAPDRQANAQTTKTAERQIDSEDAIGLHEDVGDVRRAHAASSLPRNPVSAATGVPGTSAKPTAGRMTRDQQEAFDQAAADAASPRRPTVRKGCDLLV